MLAGPASLLFSCQCWHCGEREAMVMTPSPNVTQQYLLVSMAAWLSSTGISHQNLLPHTPLIHLSAVNSSPHPGIASQSLNSSFQPLRLLGQLHPCLGYVCLVLIPYRLSRLNCFTLSLKCFSSDSDNCSMWGSDPCFSSSTC